METSSRSTLSTACFFLVLALSLAFVSGSSKEQKQPISKFPDKLNQRVVLSVTNSLEREHVVEYAKDGVSKISERIEYADGMTTLIQYQGKQFAQKLLEFYPSTSQSSERRVKSEIVFMPGSSDFHSHRAFRPDGTTIKTGQRRKDGTYETFTFYEDGKTVEKNQISSPDQFIVTERNWRKDGSTERIVTTDQVRNVFVWHYRPDNTLRMMYQYSTKGWHMPGGKFYRPDGESIKAEFKLFSDRTIVSYFDVAKREQLQIVYRKEEGDKLVLVFNPANHKPLFEQRWKHISGSFDCTGVYRLIQTEVAQAGSEPSSRKVWRRITMSEQGDLAVRLEELKIPGDESSAIVWQGSNVKVDSVLISHPDYECLALPEIKK